MEYRNRKYILLCTLIFCVLAVTGVFYFVFRGNPEEAGASSLVAEINMEDHQGRHENSLLVYVVGAVKEPGVYELPAGSRIYDAVKAAGDVIPYADLEAVNMSEKIEDGTKIHIPLNPMQINPGAAGKVNINTAADIELKTLPGVGEKTADRIIQYRNEQGGFKSKEEIKEVPTIGEGKYSKISDHITL